MRRLVAVRKFAVGSTALVAAVALPLSAMDFASASDGLGGLSDSQNSVQARSAIQARIKSGTLPGGGKFPLPNPPTAPFPTATVTALGGGVATANPESNSRYTEQVTCDPTERPGIAAFKTKVLAQFGGVDWGSVRNCTDDGTSEHLDGRAWDWHMDVNDAAAFAKAAALLQWLTQNNGVEAKRLGIMYIGYNYRIWGAYRSSEGWRVLTNSNHHTDHVHFSFTWNGAMKQTSFWTGVVAPEDYGPCRVYAGQPGLLRTGRNLSPCPTPKALPAQWKGAQLLWRGSTGTQVKVVQAKVGASVTGSFDAQTQNAVARWQRLHAIPVTGAVDAQTYFALGLGIPAGPAAPAAKIYKVLKLGSRSRAVRKLQRMLHVRITGVFNRRTVRAVKKAQRRLGMRVTGTATPRLQRRLGL